jgi:pyruvate/2-oxoglutarate dehydrogenase complex dihydrolipoamide acyltransferase (E2) component
VTQVSSFERGRRHTLLFLGHQRRQTPVLLDTDIDMGHVKAHRDATPAPLRASYVSYVIAAAGRALAAHPEANADVGGRLRPRTARYEDVTAKVAFDMTVSGTRAVVSGLVPDAGNATLGEIDARVRRFKHCDPDTDPELRGLRMLHKLPWPLAKLAFRFASGGLKRRAGVLGTFSVSALGHRSVRGFYPLGGTAVSFGVGRIEEMPVVRDGDLTVAPVMRLGLVFDHRVIDGGLAADLLDAVKTDLETFNVEQQGQAAAARALEPIAAAGAAGAAR